LGCFIPIFFLGFLFYRNFIVKDFVNSWVFYSGFCDIIWRDKKWNNSVDFLLIIFYSILNLNFNWLKFMILCKKWRKTITEFKNKSALCSWKKSRVPKIFFEVFLNFPIFDFSCTPFCRVGRERKIVYIFCNFFLYTILYFKFCF
jgi:hypothetical protein